MAVVCPNIEDAPSFDAMAVRDSVDLFALTSDTQAAVVVTGMAVTGTGSMSVAVAAGQVSINGTTYDYAGGTATIGAASTSDRRDTVVYTAGTGVQVVAGTACGYTTGTWTKTVTTSNPPVKALTGLPSNCVVLAEVYVSLSTTTIVTATNVVDKRNIQNFSNSAALEQLVRTQSLDQMSPPTGDLWINNKRIINLGSPLFSTDAARLADVQTQSSYKATSVSSTTATRWIGGLTSAATLGGANAVGDFLINRDGTIYVAAAYGTSVASASSSATTITCGSTASIVVGQYVTVISGTGAFAAGTTVSSITDSTHFVVSATPTTTLSTATVGFWQQVVAANPTFPGATNQSLTASTASTAYTANTNVTHLTSAALAVGTYQVTGTVTVGQAATGAAQASVWFVNAGTAGTNYSWLGTAGTTPTATGGSNTSSTWQTVTATGLLSVLTAGTVTVALTSASSLATVKYTGTLSGLSSTAPTTPGISLTIVKIA